MKRLSLVFCLVLMVPLAATASDLTGIHTVFINSSDAHVIRDIQHAFKKELPQVRVVSRATGADAVIEFSGRNELVSAPPQMQVEVPAAGTQTGATIEMRTITVPASESSTYDPGHMVGVVVRHGAPVVIHEGFPSEFFANQFAARFIAAWREANRQ